MIRKLLVALDGSARAPGVLAAALELAVRFDAKLLPFRVIQIPPEFPAAARASKPDELEAYLDHEALEELAVLTRGLSDRCEAPRVGHGQPWRAILDAADLQDVDVIVIGSHGYHGLDHILGTTAGKVANLAQRNVLIVHARASGAP